MKCYTVISLLLLLVIASCKEKVQKATEIIRPVKYVAASYLSSSESRLFSGTAESEIIVNLSFRSTGILTELNMKLGQEVKKHELLARLDNVQARLNYESAIEQQNSAQSQMNTTKLNMDRVRNLYEKGSSSLSEYENAKNSYRTSTGSYESSKRSVSLQKEQLSYGFLYAPEDGFLSAVNVELDENISAGQNIGVLNAGSSIEINIGLPESVINKVEKEMKVDVYFSSISKTKFKGVVSKVSPAVDQLTSTYPVKILLLDNDTDVKSGMAAEVMFNFDTDKSNADEKLIVPQQCVGEDGTGRYVFRIAKEEGKWLVHKRYVTIGELTNKGFEILEGLIEGDKVATAGLQTLLNGQSVKLVD